MRWSRSCAESVPDRLPRGDPVHLDERDGGQPATDPDSVQYRCSLRARVVAAVGT